MRYINFHVSEQDLILATNGELSARKMAKVQAHVAACWTCRTRMREIENTIVDFVHVHQRSLDAKLPPAGGPRTLLRARLGELAGSPEPHWLQRFSPISKSGLVYVGLAMVLVVLTTLAFRVASEPDRRVAQGPSHTVPDPGLTPGVTQPLTKADLCSLGDHDAAPGVPRVVALKVFEAYGVTDPRPRAYELDYLIAPELGGTNDIRNLWPQPYRAGLWDAHAKDALENHLHRLVCDGSVNLTTAQQDIAKDWIAAYKKYFQTEEPLLIHAAFLKDQPWE